MALTTVEQRDALRDAALRAAKATSFTRTLEQGPTIAGYLTRYGAGIQAITDKDLPPPTTTPGVQPAPRDVKVIARLPGGHGFQPSGYYASLDMTFGLGPQGDNTPSPAFATDDEKAERAAWGDTFEKDLTNPRKSCRYLVRVTVDQLRVEPLVGGYDLTWTLPTGWKWQDLLGNTTTHVVTSNPLVVMRLVQSPATAAINNSGFSVTISGRYP